MRWMPTIIIWLLGSILLLTAACATHTDNAPLSPVQAPACLPLRSYTPAQQQALAVQLQSIPPASPLAQAMQDYEAMRDSDRACLSSPKN